MPDADEIVAALFDDIDSTVNSDAIELAAATEGWDQPATEEVGSGWEDQAAEPDDGMLDVEG